MNKMRLILCNRLTWKSVSTIPGIQWIDEKDHQQEIKMLALKNKQSLDTSEDISQ